MLQQLDLFALPQCSTPQLGEHATIAEKFAEFHRLNPHVYAALVRLARDLKRNGWRKAGMKQLFERLRWEYAIQTQGEAFRLNNNFTAHYARLVMHREPDLRDFFETRERVAQ